MACGAYAYLIYTQAAKFDEIANNPEQYLADLAPDALITIEEKNFSSRKFKVSFEGEDYMGLSFSGKVNFGFKPTAKLVLEPFDNEPLKTLVQQAKPTLASDFNFRFIPQKFSFDSEPFKISNDNATLSVGKIQSQADVNFSENSKGEYEVVNVQGSSVINSFSFSENKDSVVISQLDINTLMKGSGQRSIDLSFSAKNFAYRQYSRGTNRASDSLSIKDLSAGLKVNEENLSILQTWKLNLDDLKAFIGGQKTNVSSVKTVADLHLPNDPEIFTLIAQNILGEDICESVPMFCSKNTLSKQEVLAKIGDSVLDGKTWLQIQPSEILSDRGNLKLSALFKVEPKNPIVGDASIEITNSGKDIQTMIGLFLPRNIYKVGSGNSISSRLTMEVEGNNLVFKGNNKKFYVTPLPN